MGQHKPSNTCDSNNSSSSCSCSSCCCWRSCTRSTRQQVVQVCCDLLLSSRCVCWELAAVGQTHDATPLHCLSVIACLCAVCLPVCLYVFSVCMMVQFTRTTAPPPSPAACLDTSCVMSGQSAHMMTLVLCSAPTRPHTRTCSLRSQPAQPGSLHKQPQQQPATRNSLPYTCPPPSSWGKGSPSHPRGVS